MTKTRTQFEMDKERRLDVLWSKVEGYERDVIVYRKMIEEVEALTYEEYLKSKIDLEADDRV